MSKKTKLTQNKHDNKRHILVTNHNMLIKLNGEIMDTMLLIQINELENNILKRKLETLLEKEKSLENIDKALGGM